MTSPVPHGEGEAVRVFRYKHRNVSLRGEDPTPPVTTLFMAYDPLPGTSYTGEDGRWMPVDTYNALLARANTAKVAADLMRARAERAEALLKECREKLGAILNLAECYGRKRGDKEDAVAARAFLSRLDDALGGAS